MFFEAIRCLGKLLSALGPKKIMTHSQSEPPQMTTMKGSFIHDYVVGLCAASLLVGNQAIFIPP